MSCTNSGYALQTAPQQLEALPENGSESRWAPTSASIAPWACHASWHFCRGLSLWADRRGHCNLSPCKGHLALISANVQRDFPPRCPTLGEKKCWNTEFSCLLLTRYVWCIPRQRTITSLPKTARFKPVMTFCKSYSYGVSPRPGQSLEHSSFYHFHNLHRPYQEHKAPRKQRPLAPPKCCSTSPGHCFVSCTRGISESGKERKGLLPFLQPYCSSPVYTS